MIEQRVIGHPGMMRIRRGGPLWPLGLACLPVQGARRGAPLQLLGMMSVF
jgi:hypothetical protein